MGTSADGEKYWVISPQNNDASSTFQVMGELLTIEGYSNSIPTADNIFPSL